jgi:4-amino-4-deoxy-L-arabinose transferase and related glycosyltransferases of PMT family
MAPPQSRTKKRNPRIYLILVVNSFAALLIFLWLAFTRNVDGDEGLYLEAARLVAQGKKLYIDFFFQQMPLIPYLYAGWMKIFGFTLMSARLFSALWTAASVFMVLWYVGRRTDSPLTVLLTSILLFANGLLLAWAPVIKTHPFNAFCLTACVVLFLEWRNGSRQKGHLLFLAAFFLGIGVNCRLTLAPYVLVFAGFILAFPSGRRWRDACLVAAGYLLSSLPTLWFFISDPHLFIQYNFLFHTRVFPRLADDAFRLKIARQVILEPQMAVLILGLYASVLLESLKGWKQLLRSDEFFVAVFVGLFFAVHLSTATPFTQYFSAIIPLMVLALLPALQSVLRYSSAFQACLMIPIFALYLLSAKPRIYFELYSVGSLEPQWELKNINATVRAVKATVKPGETCLTWWPGYAFMAGCQSVPRMENHMREHAINDRIPTQVLRAYKMKTAEEVVGDLAEKKYRVVIDGAYRLHSKLFVYTDYLLQENYRLMNQVKGVKLYVLQSRGDDQVVDAWAVAKKKYFTKSRSRQFFQFPEGSLNPRYSSDGDGKFSLEKSPPSPKRNQAKLP